MTAIPIDNARHERLRARAVQWAAQQVEPEAATRVAASTMTSPLSVALPLAAERISARRDAARKAREATAAEHGLACADCQDTGISYTEQECGCDAGRALVRKRVAAERQQWLGTLDRDLGIPRRYRDCTLETFGNPESPVLAELVDWVDNPKRQGIYLHGALGRGKTGLAVSAVREVAMTYLLRHGTTLPPRHVAQFLTVSRFLDILRPGGSAEDSVVVMRYLQGVGVLAIDDLGTEKLTDWGAERLFDVVNARHNDELPVFITSNFTLNQLSTRINQQVGNDMGGRIVERLVEGCTVLAFTEADTNWRMA